VTSILVEQLAHLVRCVQVAPVAVGGHRMWRRRFGPVCRRFGARRFRHGREVNGGRQAERATWRASRDALGPWEWRRDQPGCCRIGESTTMKLGLELGVINQLLEKRAHRHAESVVPQTSDTRTQTCMRRTAPASRTCGRCAVGLSADPGPNALFGVPKNWWRNQKKDQHPQEGP
jgi:hypothetical protein